MAEALSSSIVGMTQDGKNLTWRSYVLLILLCLSFYIPGLSSLPPTDRDESLFAQATKQMIETHDYVDIKFLGTPRYKKPVGIYWLQSASVRLLNPQHLDEIWAYRVPSVIGAIIAVLLTAALGTLLFNGTVGFAAGIMLACCIDLIVEAHIAKTDAALLASVMGVQYALARAYIKPTSGWKNAAVFWSALGIGILLKGPIVLLPLLSTLLWLRFAEKNTSWFKRLKPITGILYTLALIAPWFIAINLASHGQFAAQSGGHDFLAKIWQGQDRGHLPPGLHALVFPAIFFPFSLFTLFALPDMWQQRHERAIRFCVGWIVPTWIVFELSLTKLPHYVLPAYPAIAILSAKFFIDGFPGLSKLAKAWIPTVAVSVWLFIGTALAVIAATLPFFIDQAINPLQIFSSGILLVAQGLGLMFILQRNKTGSVVVLALGTLIFSTTLFLSTLPNLQRQWMARAIVAEARKYAPCPTLKIVSAGYEEPSLAFLAGSDTKLVPNGAYASAEMQHDLCRVGVINKTLLKEFLNAPRDAETFPYPVGSTVQGVNNGNGNGMEMFFYVMPQTRKEAPVYP